MNVDIEEIIAKLKTLGLSSYEAKAYIILLREGVLTSTEIAKKAHIPQPRVYDVLHGLEEKGLIVSSEGRPKLYRAIEPKTALQRLVEKIQEKIKESYENVVGLLEVLSKEKPRPGTGIIWRLEPLAKIKNSIIEAIEAAEHELLVSCYKHMFSFIEKPLIKAYKRGVSTCLVTYDEIEPITYVDEHRIKKTYGIVVALPDRKMVVFATDWYEPSEHTPSGYYTENKELVKLFTEYFLHNIRDLAKPVYTAFGEKVFLRRFVNVPRAIVMIDSLKKKGRKVVVRVKGKLVKNKKPIVVEGEPIDTLYDVYAGIARIIVKTSTGLKYSVGGWGAYLEDIESDVIEVIS
ncbi:Rrf2 family transcriptional regulator [Desulfurococcaceae archaeon MEX13E-LK6-19]|nr:Rrf2 family transcriptional regulator [Desulfurococcaceae archaeon MEX13E-LK6-19]